MSPPGECRKIYSLTAAEANPVKTIAIEEHFITPMYKEKVSANEFRNFYLNSRSEQIGHDIYAQNLDMGKERLAYRIDL